jgi:hypothetical protein
MNLPVSILYSKQMKKNKMWFAFQLSKQEKWNFISPSTFTEHITFGRVKYERVSAFLISHNEVSSDVWFMQQNVPLILLDGFEAMLHYQYVHFGNFCFPIPKSETEDFLKYWVEGILCVSSYVAILPWTDSLTLDTIFNHYSSHPVVLKISF